MKFIIIKSVSIMSLVQPWSGLPARSLCFSPTELLPCLEGNSVMKGSRVNLMARTLQSTNITKISSMSLTSDYIRKNMFDYTKAFLYYAMEANII